MSVYQEVHATKANEALPHGHATSLPPQRVQLLQASPVEHSRTVEHDWGRTKKQSPFRTRDVPNPHRLLNPHTCVVVGRDESHVDDTENEGRDSGDEGEGEAAEEVPLFAALHEASAIFEGRWLMNSYFEMRRRLSRIFDCADDCADGVVWRRGSVGYGEHGVRMRGETFGHNHGRFQRL